MEKYGLTFNGEQPSRSPVFFSHAPYFFIETITASSTFSGGDAIRLFCSSALHYLVTCEEDLFSFKSSLIVEVVPRTSVPPNSRNKPPFATEFSIAFINFGKGT